MVVAVTEEEFAVEQNRSRFFRRYIRGCRYIGRHYSERYSPLIACMVATQALPCRRPEANCVFVGSGVRAKMAQRYC